MVGEVINYLNVIPGEWYVDATFGGGGHSLAILQAGGKVIGLDWDKENIINGRKRLVTACPSDASYHLFHLNYCHLDEAIKRLQLSQVKGVLFDLGFSTDQLYRGRGFSFQYPTDVIDLRYNPKEGKPAWLLLRELSVGEIQRVLEIYSQQYKARELALRLHKKAQERKITIQDLMDVVQETGLDKEKKKIHPLTKIIQALRILVNRELENLECGLKKSVDILSENGRLVVISFHSGEDRLVKEFFRQNRELVTLTKRPLRPQKEEILTNPASRSARLRAAEKRGVKDA